MICSRIRERDKKITEYYVGDYYCLNLTTRNGPFACANVRGDQRTATAMGLQKPTRPRYAPVPRAPEVPPLLVQQVAQKQIWGRLQPGLRVSTRSVVVAEKYWKYSNDSNFGHRTGDIRKPDFYWSGFYACLLHRTGFLIFLDIIWKLHHSDTRLFFPIGKNLLQWGSE